MESQDGTSADFEQRQERVRSPKRQQDSQDSCQRGEQKAFREQLTQQSPPAGAQGQSDCNFSLSHRGASQQQVGNVGACDEQNQPHHSQESKELPGILFAQVALAARAGLKADPPGKKCAPPLRRQLRSSLLL